ncbi:MAG: acyl-CoA dehydrogenase family protein [Thermodesulfobacteriota bacterium]
MFGFSPSKEQKMVRDSFAEIVRDIVAPEAHDMDEAGEIPMDKLNTAWELGACTASVPSEFGGDGMAYSPILNAIVLEELAYGDMSFAVAAMLPALFINPIVDMGTDAQKKKYLPKACGEKYPVRTMAMCEPDIAFDAARPKTTAAKKNGSYVLNGAKCFVPKADKAVQMMVSASVDGAPALFIVDGKNPGVKIGERDRGLGMYALDMFPLTLENCEIPAEDRVGGEAGADYSRFLAKTRTGMAAVAAGMARASFDFARKYAKERVQFGEPIAYRQAVAFMIAEMAYETDAMRLMALKAASALEAGRDGKRESYLAKLYAGEMCLKVCDYGVQILGGHGYIRDYPQERCCRNARGIAILEAMATV